MLLVVEGRQIGDIALVDVFEREGSKWTQKSLAGARKLDMLRFSIHATTARKIVKAAATFTGGPYRIRGDDARTLQRGIIFQKAYWIDFMLKTFGPPMHRALQDISVVSDVWQQAFDACVRVFREDYLVPTYYYERAMDEWAKQENQAPGTTGLTRGFVFRREGGVTSPVFGDTSDAEDVVQFTKLMGL